MLFNSIGFLIFLVIMLFIYYIRKKKYRHFVLLLGSYVFYMCWNAYLVFLIFFRGKTAAICPRKSILRT